MKNTAQPFFIIHYFFVFLFQPEDRYSKEMCAIHGVEAHEMSKIIQSTRWREVVAKVVPRCFQLSTLNKELNQKLVEIRDKTRPLTTMTDDFLSADNNVYRTI